MLENDTLWGDTYLYGIYMGVTPGVYLYQSSSVFDYAVYDAFSSELIHDNCRLSIMPRLFLYSFLEPRCYKSCKEAYDAGER